MGDRMTVEERAVDVVVNLRLAGEAGRPYREVQVEAIDRVEAALRAHVEQEAGRLRGLLRAALPAVEHAEEAYSDDPGEWRPTWVKHGLTWDEDLLELGLADRIRAALAATENGKAGEQGTTGRAAGGASPGSRPAGSGPEAHPPTSGRGKSGGEAIGSLPHTGTFSSPPPAAPDLGSEMTREEAEAWVRSVPEPPTSVLAGPPAGFTADDVDDALDREDVDRRHPDGDVVLFVGFCPWCGDRLRTPPEGGE